MAMESSGPVGEVFGGAEEVEEEKGDQGSEGESEGVEEEMVRGKWAVPPGFWSPSGQVDHQF